MSITKLSPNWACQMGPIHFIKGSSIYDVQKNRVFDPPVHMRPHGPDPPPPLWTSTRGWHEIHNALLKWLVQWPTGPKAEIRLYDFNLFKTLLLVIYITNLYHRKISTFFQSKTEIMVKKRRQILCMRRRQYDVSGLVLIFCVDVHMGLDPLYPPST